jgi:hypothetical protein
MYRDYDGSYDHAATFEEDSYAYSARLARDSQVHRGFINMSPGHTVNSTVELRPNAQSAYIKVTGSRIELGRPPTCGSADVVIAGHDFNALIAQVAFLTEQVSVLKALIPHAESARHEAAIKIQRAWRAYAYGPGTGKLYKIAAANWNAHENILEMQKMKDINESSLETPAVSENGSEGPVQITHK